MCFGLLSSPVNLHLFVGLLEAFASDTSGFRDCCLADCGVVVCVLVWMLTVVVMVVVEFGGCLGCG